MPSLVGRKLRSLRWEWGARETILYALGVGATLPRDLPLLFEGRGPRVLPSFATVPTGIAYMGLVDELGLALERVLHGEQHTELLRPIPAAGVVTVERRVAEVWDTGRAAVIVVDELGSDERPLFRSRSSWVVLGAGGFGGDRGPRSPALEPAPEREPDLRVQRVVSAEQAALYRLSGDLNPIHIDPDAAHAAGQSRPLIHGLCTLGIVTLEVVSALFADALDGIRELGGRFTAPVYPGDELLIEAWSRGSGARFQASVAGRLALADGSIG